MEKNIYPMGQTKRKSNGFLKIDKCMNKKIFKSKSMRQTFNVWFFNYWYLIIFANNLIKLALNLMKF